MTKKRSINLIIFLSIILVIGILASFVSFTYPFAVNGNYYRYSSFINELVLGADVNDGVSIIYRTDMPALESDLAYCDYENNTILGIQEILNDAGYKDSTVTALGDEKISVVVGDVSTYQDKQDVIALIGDFSSLRFSSATDGKTKNDDDISGKYVKNVEVKEQSGNGTTYYYVDIQLNSVGTDKLETLTNTIVSASGSLYMYLGETAISNNSLEGPITDGHITMYSEENFVDRQTTQNYVNRIKTGLLDLELTQISSSFITPGLGYGATLCILIAMIIIVVLSFVFLIVKYRQLGLMAIFALAYFIVIGLGLLQSIPFVHINLSGILGMITGYGLVFSAIVTICENARKEFATGKKLHTCFKLAQSKAIAQIVVTSLFMFTAGVVCALMPTMAVQSFGLVTFVLALVGMFCSLVMFRVMIKLYSALNFYKGDKCNFKLDNAQASNLKLKENDHDNK